MRIETNTKDYGEPWKVDSARGVRCESGGVICYPLGSREEEQKLAVRIVSCVNACAGMTDPANEIKKMREAIKTANDSLNKCSRVIGAPKTYEWADEDVCDEAYNSAKASIAKLKPFINHDT